MQQCYVVHGGTLDFSHADYYPMGESHTDRGINGTRIRNERCSKLFHALITQCIHRNQVIVLVEGFSFEQRIPNEAISCLFGEDVLANKGVSFFGWDNPSHYYHVRNTC